MTLRQTFISIIIVLFITFALLSGLPYNVPMEARIFPWRPWAMFYSDSPWHQEIIAKGVTKKGDNVKVNIFDFSPKTTYAELEGNHFGWRFRVFLSNYPEIRREFCHWLLDQYNNSVEASDSRLREVQLSIGYWPKPPDESLSPEHEKRLIQCNTNV